eukprot:COSAG03_NODE_518_length_7242_cov_58.514350_8_plen_116_part_00
MCCLSAPPVFRRVSKLDKQRDRETERQRDRQRDRQTDRQTGTHRKKRGGRGGRQRERPITRAMVSSFVPMPSMASRRRKHFASSGVSSRSSIDHSRAPPISPLISALRLLPNCAS